MREEGDHIFSGYGCRICPRGFGHKVFLLVRVYNEEPESETRRIN